MRKFSIGIMLATASLFLGGCATKPPPYDYTAFKAARPSTLLVMPPINESLEVNATPSVWSHSTRPLAEAGYYVLPVTLVDEKFKQNGIQTATDAQQIPYSKLREIFGADGAVYIKVVRYGTDYNVIHSETRVEVEGRIIDLRTGQELWAGTATASSAEQRAQGQGGIVGLLITAVAQQIIDTAADASYDFAGVAQARLLRADNYRGVLPGPRLPQYSQPTATQ